MIGVALQEWGMRRLEGLAARFGRASGLPEHLETGLLGEREALFFLRRRGFTVVARRWGSARVRGDIDLVGWQGGVLCFVEVKTRTVRMSRGEIAAEFAVDWDKREQLRRLGRAYLKGFDEAVRDGVQARFDVVSVYLVGGGVTCERIEGAFGWRERHGRDSFGV